MDIRIVEVDENGRVLRPGNVQENKPRGRHARNGQRGSVLVEYGLYLLVILIAVVGSYAYFSSNSVGEQTNLLGNDLTSLAGKVKSTYAGQYANVSNASLDTGGFFKNLVSMQDTAGTVTVSPGGGLLTVTPGTLNIANDSVQYQITNLPDSACQPIISAIMRSASQISINGTVIKSSTVTFNPANMTCQDCRNAGVRRREQYRAPCSRRRLYSTYRWLLGVDEFRHDQCVSGLERVRQLYAQWHYLAQWDDGSQRLHLPAGWCGREFSSCHGGNSLGRVWLFGNRYHHRSKRKDSFVPGWCLAAGFRYGATVSSGRQRHV